MANFTTIEAASRERAGKGAARATRRAGQVPAVIYGAKQAPTLISLEPRAVLREITRAGWRSRLYEIQLDGQPVRALMRDVQLHPVRDSVEHVDFQRLAAGEKIHVAVAVQFVNELVSPGLKRGGVLNVVRHTVEVLCDPDEVPEAFEADLGTLEINDNVRFSDLRGLGSARPVIADRDFVIATVAAPTVVAELEPSVAVAVPAAPAKGAKGGGKPAAKPAAKK